MHAAQASGTALFNLPQVRIMCTVVRWSLDFILWSLLIGMLYLIIRVVVKPEVVVQFIVYLLKCIPWYLEYVIGRMTNQAYIEAQSLAIDAARAVTSELTGVAASLSDTVFTATGTPVVVPIAPTPGPPGPTHSPGLLATLTGSLGVAYGRFGVPGQV